MKLRRRVVCAPAVPFLCAAILGVLVARWAPFDEGFWRFLFFLSFGVSLLFSLGYCLFYTCFPKRTLGLREELSLEQRALERQTSDSTRKEASGVQSETDRSLTSEIEILRKLESESEDGLTWKDSLRLYELELEWKKRNEGQTSAVVTNPSDANGTPNPKDSQESSNRGRSTISHKREEKIDGDDEDNQSNSFWTRLRFLCFNILKGFCFYFFSGLFWIWATFGILAGWHYERFYNYFEQDEIGFFIPEEGIGTTVEFRVNKTPILYRSTESSAENTENKSDKIFVSSDVTVFTANVIKVKNGGYWQEYSGKISVSIQCNATNLRIGDKVIAVGRLERYKKQHNPGERDRELYYRAQRILTSFSIVDQENYERLPLEKYSFPIRIARFFEDVRLRASKVLEERLSHRCASVAKGMTFGFRNDVDDETNDAFRRTGTAHLLAISGLHIALVVGAFTCFLNFFGFSSKSTAIATLCLVFFYYALTDARAPVLRATILIVVICIGTLLERKSSALNSLSIAALVILTINPCELFQLGAQLSFLATGVFLWIERSTIFEQAEYATRRYLSNKERKNEKNVENSLTNNDSENVRNKKIDEDYLSDKRFEENSFDEADVVFFNGKGIEATQNNNYVPLNRRLALAFKGLRRRAWASFSSNVIEVNKTSFWIWLVSAPLLLSFTNLLTPIALIANPIIWAPATFALLLAFLLAFVGVWASFCPFNWDFAIMLLGTLVDRTFTFFLSVIDLFARPQLGAIHIPTPPLFMLWLFYAPLVLWTLFPRIRPRRVTLLLLFFLWIGGFFYVGHYETQKRLAWGNLEIKIFSVGHGAAVLGIFPDGRTFLYDCGTMNAPERVAKLVAKNLFDSQRRKIDLAVISHADSDHYSGFVDLVQATPIQTICVSNQIIEKWDEFNTDKASDSLKKLRRLFEQNGSNIEPVVGQMSLEKMGFPEISILYPTKDDEQVAGNNTNANSLVVMIDYLGRRVLLPGDIDARTPRFLSENPIKVDLMLAPHHGGKSICSKALFDWGNPTWVVISNNGFLRNTSLEKELNQDGRVVLHTQDCGCVQITIADVLQYQKTAQGTFNVESYLDAGTRLDFSN